MPVSWNADRWQTFMTAARMMDERGLRGGGIPFYLIGTSYARAASHFRDDLKTRPHETTATPAPAPRNRNVAPSVTNIVTRANHFRRALDNMTLFVDEGYRRGGWDGAMHYALVSTGSFNGYSAAYSAAREELTLIPLPF